GGGLLLLLRGRPPLRGVGPRAHERRRRRVALVDGRVVVHPGVVVLLERLGLAERLVPGLARHVVRVLRVPQGARRLRLPGARRRQVGRVGRGRDRLGAEVGRVGRRGRDLRRHGGYLFLLLRGRLA